MKLSKIDILTLEALLTSLEKKTGRLIIVFEPDREPTEWLLSFAWGKEAEDSPMYGATIDEIATTLPEILEKVRDQFKE